MEDNLKQAPIESVSIDDANVEMPANENNENDLGNSEIDVLNAQIADLNDKYLRLAAELENTRRRASLDADSAARHRAMSVAGNFLPVMDAVEAGLLHTPNDEGIKAMARAMQSAFAQIGIVKIETIGQQLNPQFNNAISVVDVPQSDEPCAAKPVPNTIIDEAQSGYMFGDTVLRPAMVIVSK